MSKYDELWANRKEGKPLPQATDIFGTFYCQYCGAEVDEALYYPTEGILAWNCPVNHHSYIENFSIG